jgi:hypothetical protein
LAEGAQPVKIPFEFRYSDFIRSRKERKAGSFRSGMSAAQLLLTMDPVTCPMCDGAIPGNEIQTRSTCPSCGADLAALVRKRLAAKKVPGSPAQSEPTRFKSQAALFSLFAPCIAIAVNLLGHGAVNGSPVGMLALGAICSFFIIGGFILGIIALFASKGDGARQKAIWGICINGLIITFAIVSLFSHQRVAAKENKGPNASRTYISGE